MAKRPKIGDVVTIPLPGGQYGYGQYVFWDEKNGPLIQVYDLVTETPIDSEQLNQVPPRFPPVFTGLFAAVRTGLWTVIGNLPVHQFEYPKFISGFYDDKSGVVRQWFLWDGQRYIRLGRRLPETYRHLEQLVGWDPHDVAQRIETGTTPLDFILDL
jgi:hypothetical protein